MSGMIMRGSDWAPPRGIDRRRLSEARLEAHHAVEWLGRAARAYVPPQPDDEHTNVGWDAALGGFVTHPLRDGARLSLKITDLTFALHGGEGSTRVQSFSLDSRTDAQARQWLGERLRARGRPRRGLWPGRPERCVGRACGMVRQCRSFARCHPQTNARAQIGGLAPALLAAPLRS